jgi:hypothetical protein
MSMTTSTHELKCDPEPFAELLANRMTSDIRNDDRLFQVGDTLIFRETLHSAERMAKGEPLVYTGRAAWRFCSHVQRGYGLKDGHVALSFMLTDAVKSVPAVDTTVSQRVKALLKVLDRDITSPWVVQELEEIGKLLEQRA